MDAVINLIGSEAPREQPGDYLDEEGLLICSVCKERKQVRLDIPEPIGPRTVYCLCECGRAAFDAADEARRRAEEQRYIDELRRNSLMDLMFKDCTFQCCQITQHNKRPAAIARRYAERFQEMLESNRGLLFCGEPGTGKSYLAACIANHLLDERVPVMMTSFVKLNTLLGNFRRDEDDETIIRRLNMARLLIIDDLGVERGTDYSLEHVYNVIDSRSRAKRPLILTTNLSFQQMQDATDMRYRRIYDRIFQMCYPVEFSGPSWRMVEASKLYNEMNAIFPDE